MSFSNFLILHLVLLAFKFHPPKVEWLHYAIHPAKVTDQGPCYCNADAWGWHNTHQCGVISIKKVKVKSSMAKSLPVENLLPQNVGSIINYLQ